MKTITKTEVLKKTQEVKKEISEVFGKKFFEIQQAVLEYNIETTDLKFIEDLSVMDSVCRELENKVEKKWKIDEEYLDHEFNISSVDEEVYANWRKEWFKKLSKTDQKMVKFDIKTFRSSATKVLNEEYKTVKKVISNLDIIGDYYWASNNFEEFIEYFGRPDDDISKKLSELDSKFDKIFGNDIDIEINEERKEWFESLKD
jgi:hypothetical protein